MYNIGQFRRTQQSSYSTNRKTNITTSTQQAERTSSGDIGFYDVCGNLSGAGIMNNQNHYYLQFTVQKRQDSEQVFYLKLCNTSQSEDNTQLIEEYKVAKGTGSSKFEVIIVPNSNYDQIIWQLQRIGDDYTIRNTDGTYGRIMNVTVNSYTQLIDIMPILKLRYTGMRYLTKIGIQGPPSLLMCINGQQIRLGKNGIYEINNGINITSINFVPKKLSSNNLEYFIMDFEY